LGFEINILFGYLSVLRRRQQQRRVELSGWWLLLFIWRKINFNISK